MSCLSRTSGHGGRVLKGLMAMLFLSGSCSLVAPPAHALETVTPAMNRQPDRNDVEAASPLEAQGPMGLYELAGAYRDGRLGKTDPVRARQLYERSALQEFAWSQFELGLMYARGEGGPRDLTKALHWYRKASGNGDARARVQIARLASSRQVEIETGEVVRALESAANQDQADAQLLLGLRYVAGDGVPQDLARALQWLERSAVQLDAGRLLLDELRSRRKAGRSVVPEAMLADWQAAMHPQGALLSAMASYFGIGRPLDEPSALAAFEQLAKRGHAAAAYHYAIMRLYGLGGADDAAEAKRWCLTSAKAGFAPAQAQMANFEAFDKKASQAWLRKAASQGYVPAQAQLGSTLVHEARSQTEGKDWLLKAAKRGHARAAHAFASYVRSQDDREGLKWLRFAAERGLAEAQAELGNHYETEGAPENAQAILWWQKAAEQGDLNAMQSLGKAYSEGRLIAKDLAAATRWYLRVARTDLDESLLYFLLPLFEDPDAVSIPFGELIPWLRQKADGGSLLSAHLLGVAYQMGWGVPQDLAQALAYYRKAAAGQHPQAFVALGRLHAEGKGVVRDEQEALRWFQKAAEEDFPEGKIALADMYRAGRGVPKDVSKAIQLLEEAGHRGSGKAHYELALMFEQGLGIPVDLAKAVQYLEQSARGPYPLASRRLDNYVQIGGKLQLVDAARYVSVLTQQAVQGDPKAQLELGRYLMSTRGPRRDLDKAVEWMTRAANQGHAPAQRQLAKLYAGGVVERQGQAFVTRFEDKAAAQHWLEAAASAGDVEAQYELAVYYSAPPTLDLEQAFRYALKAGESGHVPAQRMVAGMYAAGKGVSADEAQALTWYAKAAAHGDVQSHARVAELYAGGRSLPRDPRKAFEWYLKGALAGDTSVYGTVARLYEEGGGIERDLTEAVRWYKMASQAYDTDATYALARLYLSGPITLRSRPEALRWFLIGVRQVTEGGDGTEAFEDEEFRTFRDEYRTLASAHYAVARMCETGVGLARDLAEAQRWFAEAARMAHAHPNVAALAHFKLGISYMEGWAAQPDTKLALESFRKGSELIVDLSGFPFELGEHLSPNWEFDRRFPQVVARLHQAAAAGFAPAACQLGGLYRIGRGVPRSDARARAWYEAASRTGYWPALLDQQPDPAGSDEVALVQLHDVARKLLQQVESPAELSRVLLVGQAPESYRDAERILDQALKAGKLGKYQTRKAREFHETFIRFDYRSKSPKQLKALAQSLGVSYAEIEDLWESGKLQSQAMLSKSAKERLELMARATKHDAGGTSRMLGELYESGTGLPVDLVEAYKWNCVAAALGHLEGRWALARLQEKLTASQVQEAQERAHRWWLGHFNIKL